MVGDLLKTMGKYWTKFCPGFFSDTVYTRFNLSIPGYLQKRQERQRRQERQESKRRFINRMHTAWRISSKAAVVIRPSVPGSRLTAQKNVELWIVWDSNWACWGKNCKNWSENLQKTRDAKPFPENGGKIRFGCAPLSWKTCLSAAGDRSLAVAAATLASTTA